MVGLNKVVGAIARKADLNHCVSEIAETGKQLRGIFPVFDVHHRRPILRLESPQYKLFRGIGVAHLGPGYPCLSERSLSRCRFRGYVHVSPVSHTQSVPKMPPDSYDVPKEPLSDDYGFDRGTPVNRRYIESFLTDHQSDISGSVLEVGDARYSEAFGNDSVASQTVVDIDTSNPKATLIADLGVNESLRPDRYDCILLVETLHLLPEPAACLENCWRALRPEGTLLITVPALKRLNPAHPEADYWRFTPAGLQALLAKHWPGRFSVRAYGNLRACVAFLAARVVEECDEDDLELSDPRFPLTVVAHAGKP